MVAADVEIDVRALISPRSAAACSIADEPLLDVAFDVLIDAGDLGLRRPRP